VYFSAAQFGGTQLLNNLESLWSTIVNDIKSFNSAPALIQNIGLALLGILVPFAIAILIDVYQKKGRGRDDFEDLDLHVILDYVFNIQLLIVYSVIVFLPLVFWEISSWPIRLFELALSAIGQILIVRIIINVYRWTKGDVYKFRLSYLRQLKNSQEMEVVWRSVWAATNIERPYEIEFFRIFSTKIDGMISYHGRKRRFHR
jgi:hypothetical protein